MISSHPLLPPSPSRPPLTPLLFSRQNTPIRAHSRKQRTGGLGCCYSHFLIFSSFWGGLVFSGLGSSLRSLCFFRSCHVVLSLEQERDRRRKKSRRGRWSEKRGSRMKGAGAGEGGSAHMSHSRGYSLLPSPLRCFLSFVSGVLVSAAGGDIVGRVSAAGRGRVGLCPCVYRLWGGTCGSWTSRVHPRMRVVSYPPSASRAYISHSRFGAVRRVLCAAGGVERAACGRVDWSGLDVCGSCAAAIYYLFKTRQDAGCATGRSGERRKETRVQSSRTRRE
jgi:hypothetical protein